MRKHCLVMNDEFVQIGIIAKYESLEYTLKYCGIGSFTIKLPITEKNIKYMKNGIWFYLDGKYLGFKESERIDTDNLQIVISGNLCEVILQWAVFPKTQNFYDTIPNICEEMVRNNLISEDERKKEILEIIPHEISDTTKVRVQRTGDYISDAITDLLSEKEYGFKVNAVMRKERTEGQQAITALQFQCYYGKDRSVENEQGNRPVVFSQRLSNLQGTDYKKDETKERNYFYIAGEDSGTERKFVEIDSGNYKQLYRKEEYIDARDLQSTKEDGTSYTDSEYQEILLQRGYEKQKEFDITESFTCKVAVDKKGCVFGVDYDLGDYVQIIDDVSEITAKMQITQVKRVLSETEILSVTFGYKELNFIQKLKKKGVL